jgi:hypothetical protein
MGIQDWEYDLLNHLPKQTAFTHPKYEKPKPGKANAVTTNAAPIQQEEATSKCCIC